MGNGSYFGVLAFAIADSYDLTVTLNASTHIMASPLTNKILVVPGLVQAAHTHLQFNNKTSLGTLTAGVTYEFTIEAMDIF